MHPKSFYVCRLMVSLFDEPEVIRTNVLVLA